MATYSGFLATNGLPELAEDGAVDFAAMTARRAVHVTLVDPQGVPVGTFIDDEPGSTPERPIYVANPDGQNLRVCVEGAGSTVTMESEVAGDDVYDTTNIENNRGLQIFGVANQIGSTVALSNNAQGRVPIACDGFGKVIVRGGDTRADLSGTDCVPVSLAAAYDISGNTMVSSAGGLKTVIVGNAGECDTAIQGTLPGLLTYISESIDQAAIGTTGNFDSDFSVLCPKYYSLQVTRTGANVTAWTVNLQLSNDGINFTTSITHAFADGSGTMKYESTPKVAKILRINVSAITTSGGDTIEVLAVASR